METTQQDERRKFPRFSDRSLAGAQVTLLPCPPLYGEAASGYLVDLSAGGMALLMSDLIPKNVLLKMQMTLPDGYQINSAITVRRVAKQSRGHSDYLHGIEFLSPSPEMIERIQVMAAAVLACNERTQKGIKEICQDTCILSQICKRPQRIAKNIQPALIELAQTLNDADENWRPTKADIDKFFSEAA